MAKFEEAVTLFREPFTPNKELIKQTVKEYYPMEECPHCGLKRHLSKRIGNKVKCKCGSLLERVETGWKLLEPPNPQLEKRELYLFEIVEKKARKELEDQEDQKLFNSLKEKFK